MDLRSEMRYTLPTGTKKTSRAVSARAAEGQQPVRPAVRHTHPRTGRIVLIGSFSRGVSPFVRSVHSLLAERMLADGFKVQLSAGEEPKELERAEGLLITDPAWFTLEREEELRGKKQGFALLTMRQACPNAVFLDAAGAWMSFLLEAEQRKTERFLLSGSDDEREMPSLLPPAPLLKSIPPEKRPVFQVLPEGAAPLPDEGSCLLTCDEQVMFRFPAGESAEPEGRFWTACMLPGCDIPSFRSRSFRADPEAVAREMQRILYRQMKTGNTSDPGAILPVLWGAKKV